MEEILGAVLWDLSETLLWESMGAVCLFILIESVSSSNDVPLSELLSLVISGRMKKMFYLMMHSTHFIYGYMVSDWKNEEEKEQTIKTYK